MKRSITLIVSILLIALGATAQKLSYSAVVRNSSNELVANANVTVTIAISPNPNGTPVVYSETHDVTTSPNGLVSLTIGDGTPVSGSLSNVSWSTAYVISEFMLPDGSHVSGIMPVSAVPYAIYAETISPQGLLDVVQSMTPEQIAALRDSMGIPQPVPEPQTFSCGTSQMIDASGNRYETVLIGTQCWTKTNLRTTKYRDGRDIQTEGSPAACYQPAANVVENYTDSIFGLYYTWYAAADTGSSKLCPAGWHVPTYADWTTLTGYLKGNSIFWCDNNSSNIAQALASKQYWASSSFSCTVGTIADNDKTGFSAIPAGYRQTDGSFGGSTNYAKFWSSTFKEVDAFGKDNAYILTLYTYNRFINQGEGERAADGLSVRCLRDDAGDTIVSPTVTTAAATGVTTAKATLHGSYTNPGNLTITSTGFEWKTVDASSYNVVNALGDTMSYELTTLIPDTQYIYRAFAATADSTYYGDDVTFTTDPVIFPTIGNPCPGDTTVTDHEGNVYNTVKIGNQCWTRENMRCTTSPKGSLLPGETSGSGTFSYTQAYYYENNQDNIPTSANGTSVSGLLYNWAGAMDTSATDMFNLSFTNRRGICPEGWHVPSSEEWSTMEATLNDDPRAGRLAGGDFWRPIDANGSEGAPGDYDYSLRNSSEFLAVPAGYYNTSSIFISSTDATFWTSTSVNNTEAIYHRWYYNFTDITKGGVNKRFGRSVRCVKDTESEPQTFSCGTSQMIDASGSHYETVQIGGQCWTKTNLRTTKFRNGNPIPEDIDPDQSSSASFSRISPDYTQTFPDSTFGFYYNWYAAADTGNSKLCPDGWHVPNDGDWMVLSSYLRGNYACGNNLDNNAKAMADSLLWGDYNVDCSVGKDQENNNASGFSAVPAGYLFYGEYSPIMYGSVAYFWTAMPSEDSYAKYYVVSRYLAELNNYTNPKISLLSVRCIKDDTTTIVRPVVTTDSATAVTTVSAKLYGTLVNPNDIVIVKKGFEWKLSSKNYYDIKDVTGTEFVTTLGNLIPDTQYTFRAFINYDGTTYYGDELTFKTPVKPTVTTGNATNIALTSATISGTISNPDQVTLQAKGFLWKKSHGVYEYDTVKFTGGNAMTHTFSDLTPNTKYDYKAFIKYDNKTVYGEELSFTTPNHPEVSCGTMTDADGNLYQTVKVGSQCWTKTNLRTTKYRKGSTISNQIGTTTPAYYRLSNTDKSTDSIVSLTTAPDSIFGFYYNGYAAVRDSLCPAGWHVPDTNDWKDLIGCLKARPEYWCDNDNSNLAKAVASRNYWFNVETPPITYTINQDAVPRPCSPQYQGPDYLNDASYFSAIPAGAWYDNLGGNIDTLSGLGGREFDPGKDAHFWSSSTQPGSDSTGYFFRLGIVTYDVVALAYDALKYGRSIRCLRDEPVSENQSYSDAVKFHGYVARRPRGLE